MEHSPIPRRGSGKTANEMNTPQRQPGERTPSSFVESTPRSNQNPGPGLPSLTATTPAAAGSGTSEAAPSGLGQCAVASSLGVTRKNQSMAEANTTEASLSSKKTTMALSNSTSSDSTAISTPVDTDTNAAYTSTDTNANTAANAITTAAPDLNVATTGPKSPRRTVSQNGLVLGLEALERQQIESELKRLPPKSARTPYPAPRGLPSETFASDVMMPSMLQPEDDDNTEQSSTITMTGNAPRPRIVSNNDRQSSIGRFIRKRLNSDSNFNNLANSGYDEEDGMNSSGALIYGDLLKKGRNGKWQRRFFETDGESLSYYKNRHRTRLLASLDLCKVGEIVIDKEDPSGCIFHIQVSGRPYTLRSENVETCKDWVITLNRVKEARMQIGGFNLVSPKFKPPPDLLDERERCESELTPRVVVRANRQRTRGVVDEHVKTWDQLVARSDGPPDLISGSPSAYRKTVGLSPEQEQESPERVSTHLSPEALARWEKRRSLVYSAGKRIARWVNRLRDMRCNSSTEDDVLDLDNHVHPPGHDNPNIVLVQKTGSAGGSEDSSSAAASVGSGSASASQPGVVSGSAPPSPCVKTDAMKFSDWTGKETDERRVLKSKGSPGSSQDEQDEQEEARELS